MQPLTVAQLAHELGVTGRQVRRLTDQGVLPVSRTPGGHRRYALEEAKAAYVRHRLGRSSQLWAPRLADQLGSAHLLVNDLMRTPPIFDRRYELSEPLDENDVWHEVAPLVFLGPEATKIAQFGFTEMFNNAIDHSGGVTVNVRVWQTEDQILVEISDDGSGVYSHLASGLGLEDELTALQELHKGKRTTAPDRHSGEGIFFTSKAVRLFRLSANGLAWIKDNERSDTAVGASPIVNGTQVVFELDPSSTTELVSVFKQYTDDDHAFTTTNGTVELFALGVNFISRSQAKRLMHGMEVFTKVLVDFNGVDTVGQGFVDEMIRVWPTAHPGVEIEPINMSPEVEFMVTRGLRNAEQ